VELSGVHTVLGTLINKLQFLVLVFLVKPFLDQSPVRTLGQDALGEAFTSGNVINAIVEVEEAFEGFNNRLLKFSFDLIVVVFGVNQSGKLGLGFFELLGDVLDQKSSGFADSEAAFLGFEKLVFVKIFLQVLDESHQLGGVLELSELSEEVLLGGVKTHVLLFGECLYELLFVKDVAISVVEELLVEKVEVFVTLGGDHLEDVLGNFVKLVLDLLLLVFDMLADGFEIFSLAVEDFSVLIWDFVVFHGALSVLIVMSGGHFKEVVEGLELGADGNWVFALKEAFDAVEFLLSTEFEIDSLDCFLGMEWTGDIM
jgi:hypothetical protein